MSEITRLLNDIQQGEDQAAEDLLPLVYDELRRLARAKLAHEKPGHTLLATALVHEAYVRLVDQKTPQNWQSQGHFYQAAAEAMRRILIESARRKKAVKRGGGWERDPVEVDQIAAPSEDFDLLELDAALACLERKDRRKAELVKLRYFAGLTMKEAAAALGISLATAERDWSYARAWLFRELSRGS